DRFPALLERREVPPLAVRAHHPQPSLRRVERQPLPDGKRLERLVRAEGFIAEEASGKHEGGTGNGVRGTGMELGIGERRTRSAISKVDRVHSTPASWCVTFDGAELR